MDSERTEATARGPHSHRTIPDERNPNAYTYTHQLGVALNRALERRLGRMPSPTRVNMAVDALKGSPFVQHAIRAQKQLASLHAQLEKARDQQVHMTDAVKDTSISSTRLPKRPLGHDDNVSEFVPPRETKRARVESTGSQLPSTEAKLDTQAPGASMSRQGALNALRSTCSSDSTSAELLGADPARLQAVIDDFPTKVLITDTKQSTNNTTTMSDLSREPTQHSPGASISRQGALNAQRSTRSSDSTSAELLGADPARLQAVVDDFPTKVLITDTKQLTNNTTTMSDPSRGTTQHSPFNGSVDGENNGHLKPQAEHSGMPASVDTSSDGTHVQDKLRPGQAPSLSISTSIPEAQGVPLATAASPSTAMGFPVYTLQPVPSSALQNLFVAKVPGIWAIQVGKPSVGQTDVAFEVDQDTVNAVHRWATHRRGFDPNDRHVVVYLVALQASAVSAAQQSLSQSPGGITPEAFALAVRDLQPQWPDDGSLVLQLNAGQPEEQAWFPSDMSGGTRLDVSGAVRVGANSLSIVQLRGMADTVFVVYASPPTPEVLSAALEWEKSRKLYSFVRPSSG